MSDYADPRDADSDLQSSSMDFNDDIDFMSSFFGDKDAPMLWNNDIEEAFSGKNRNPVLPCSHLTYQNCPSPCIFQREQPSSRKLPF